MVEVLGLSGFAVPEAHPCSNSIPASTATDRRRGEGIAALITASSQDVSGRFYGSIGMIVADPEELLALNDRIIGRSVRQAGRFDASLMFIPRGD